MKKISALVAAIATVLLSVFAFAPSALAADYSATINSSANADGTATVTVTLDEATVNAGYSYVGVQVDSADISNVKLAAQKTYGWWKVNSARTAKFTFTTLNCSDTKFEVLAAKDAQGTSAVKVGESTVKFPATCKVSDTVVTSATSATSSKSGALLAQTGATVMPYAVAALLLAAAGVAMFALRKSR